jgi:hypothetical protein
MICSRIEGGLGNQLFQYAAARSLANRLNTELVLDISPLQSRARNVTKRVYELGIFRINARIADKDEIKYINALCKIPRISRLLTRWNIVCENELEFNKKFNEASGDIYLKGYWQSYRYFSNISSEICNELLLSEPLSLLSEATAARIDNVESIAVHVRRGDYVSSKSAAAMHGALSSDYYQNAINSFLSKISRPSFFVFSDDPEWCRSNLYFNKSTVEFIEHNTGSDSWQDLILMSRCSHLIIANSSFSWWAAWLGDQRLGLDSRIVVAPVSWFANQLHDTSDRFPRHWLTAT